jgi:hypothetical protein
VFDLRSFIFLLLRHWCLHILWNWVRNFESSWKLVTLFLWRLNFILDLIVRLQLFSDFLHDRQVDCCCCCFWGIKFTWHFMALGVVHNERLINLSLKCSLLGFTDIWDLHIVGFFDLKSTTFSIHVIETILTPGRVRSSIPSLMHHFNVFAKSHTCWGTLRSICHDRYLFLETVRACRFIEVPHCNSRSYGIVVWANGEILFELILFPGVKLLLNHLKAVSINPQFLISVKSIHE